MRPTGIGIAACLIGLPACAPTGRTGFDSPVPSEQIAAVGRVVRAGDASTPTLRRLVELLDADDPAVRLMAITALERLTGETKDYRHYDPPARRRAAIERWVAALDGCGPGGAPHHG